MYRTCGTENFEIPNDCLRVGMVCAAVYQERWHRAEIVQIIDDDEVTVSDVSRVPSHLLCDGGWWFDYHLLQVFYYDYGTTATISRYHVLYLHKEFADYQAEALRGCLDLVQPVGGTWTHDACKYFASITVSDPVYAEITSICSADHVWISIQFDTCWRRSYYMSRSIVPFCFFIFAEKCVLPQIVRDTAKGNENVEYVERDDDQ